MTTRCRQYAIECTRDAFNADGSNDGDNVDFMESLIYTAGEFESGDSGDVSEFGYGDMNVDSDTSEPDFEEIDMDDYLAEREAIERAVGETECVKIVDLYMAGGTCWLDEWDILLEELQKDNEATLDAEEVIRWDLFQLPVQLRRAVSGKIEGDFEFEEDVFGSAKVVLLGADRSLAAWKVVREALPEEKRDSVADVIHHLERLVKSIELEIPEARSFKRPGFDD